MGAESRMSLRQYAVMEVKAKQGCTLSFHLKKMVGPTLSVVCELKRPHQLSKVLNEIRRKNEKQHLGTFIAILP